MTQLKLFDLDYLQDVTNGTCVTVDRTHKGLSVFAVQKIPKGQKICYYKFKVRKDRDKQEYLTNYRICLRNNKNKTLKNLVGDLYEGSIRTPCSEDMIPYCGYLVNEACETQRFNAGIELEIQDWKLDDIGKYVLYALEDIGIGEEICWFYGKEYKRDYKIHINE
jgi:hypothetical protein